MSQSQNGKSQDSYNIIEDIPLSERKFYITLQQKQLFIGAFRKKCSESVQQIYRRSPMPKCDFNKVDMEDCFCCMLDSKLESILPSVDPDPVRQSVSKSR